jgi:hypothetical protein
MAQKIQIRRGTTSQWSTTNPILASGEIGYDTTLKQAKVGDGATAWNSLGFTTNTVINTTGTVPTTGWSGSGPFTIAVTVSGILSTDVPIIDLETSGVSFANLNSVANSWSRIYRAVTSTNTVTFYATAVPTIALPFKLQVVR